MAAANAGMVELHTWNSTAAAIARPDRMMLDLDPGEGVPWEQVREAAVLVRALLQELGLQSWLKTSGGIGQVQADAALYVAKQRGRTRVEVAPAG